MEEEIFRKKSLEQVKSPDSLDDYIRVTNPGVWLLLATVTVLLIGILAWGFFGRMESTVPVTVTVKDGAAGCLVKEENITSVREGMTVRFADREAILQNIGEWEEAGYLCSLDGVKDLADGFYEGKIVVESYRPISFIIN